MTFRRSVLFAVLVLVVSACGDSRRSAPQDPIVGTWVWCGMSDTMGGTVVRGDTGGIGSITFSPGGTFTNSRVFSAETGTWTAYGSSYSLSAGGNNYQAMVSGGVLYINLSGLVMCFD
jgi:hypothetical protein